MQAVIQIRGLQVQYDEIPVLKGIDLEVSQGEILGYIGPNGAGKTTTVKALIGLLTDFDGEIRVCGIDVREDPLGVKRRIGYVPESAALYEALTPMEHLAFVGRMHGMPLETVATRSRQLLDLVGLADQTGLAMAGFSKGMRQKVLILAALLHDPDVLLLDEPLSGLDANSAVTMKEVFGRLAAAGKTVFYCSHVMEVVERLCHRIAILSDGEVVANGPFEELQSMAQAHTLEHLFTQLTSEGQHEEVAAEVVRVLTADVP